MAEDDGLRPPSSRDVAGEDFLYHLYRGSELLKDDRVHDAKAELEQALNLQPHDPKSQDLLAIVYFRLGLYPRAIQIYERLILTYPDAITPRINLALSYLKTGQPAQARKELERVLQINPTHSRAWGYLGLAFQRLGDLERASHAFAAGGHDGMARRLLEMQAGPAPTVARPEQLTPEQAAVSKSAGEAFDEIDKKDGGFRADAGTGEGRAPSGTWTTMEPGREGGRSSGSFVAVTAFSAPLSTAGVPSRPDGSSAITATNLQAVATPSHNAARTSGPQRAQDLARQMLLVFPRDQTISLHSTGLVLVQSTTSFAARFDAVRAMAYPAGWTTSVLLRRQRGRTTDEPLGGPVSPVYEIGGRGELVLGPTLGQRLHPLVLDELPLYLRETAVLGFDPTVSYENGRLPVGDGESISLLQLRGAGNVIAALPPQIGVVEVASGNTTALRALAVLGWVGQLVPRALTPSEAPAGVRGFISFTGEGMVFVDVR